jgi:hypothetical protein
MVWVEEIIGGEPAWLAGVVDEVDGALSSAYLARE